MSITNYAGVWLSLFLKVGIALIFIALIAAIIGVVFAFIAGIFHSIRERVAVNYIVRADAEGVIRALTEARDQMQKEIDESEAKKK